MTSFSVTKTDVLAVNKENLVSLMDERGNWRRVPASSGIFPQTVLMTLTPFIANKILETCNINNRNLETRQVSRYATDMKEGRWKLHGNGIQFDKNGRLIDGQHRLAAIVRSDTNQPFMITFGIDPESVVTIDEGRRRSNLDVANIVGIDDMSKHSLATASYILEEKGDKVKMSRSQIIAFAILHKEALSFVCDLIKTKGFTQSPISAVLVRAYYSYNKDPAKLAHLRRFINLLQISGAEIITQRITEEDNAPLVLQNFITRSNGKNTGSFRKELYDKTKSAVLNFMMGVPITRLYGISEEQFPLPEEV